MNHNLVFSGSYREDDVQFLLKPITLPDTPIAEKEALIQSGQKHYSQLLSHEQLPPPDYLGLFHQAMAANRVQVAGAVRQLAAHIAAARPNGITLVSLARAGTPIGVLLKRVLAVHHHLQAAHYSVSIIRDVGLDTNALRYILQRHAPETLVFVDGWTGKGVIARQLAESLAEFAKTDGINIAPDLHVLADLSGSAAVAASGEDYLIPSCILNATVSGLVSRSVYDPALLSAEDFHGCVYYHDFAAQDWSHYFVDTIMATISELAQHGLPAAQPWDKHRQQQLAQALLEKMSRRYQIGHSHYLKPGLGESTRVLLRREARLLLLKAPADPATAHLRWLAAQKTLPVELFPDMPYHAVALIKETLT